MFNKEATSNPYFSTHTRTGLVNIRTHMLIRAEFRSFHAFHTNKVYTQNTIQYHLYGYTIQLPYFRNIKQYVCHHSILLGLIIICLGI